MLVPPSEFQTPVDLFASLSVKEIGRERVHCTMSQWKCNAWLFLYGGPACVWYSMLNRHSSNYIFDCFADSQFSFCWSSGEFTVWSLHKHSFRLLQTPHLWLAKKGWSHSHTYIHGVQLTLVVGLFLMTSWIGYDMIANWLGVYQ